MGYFTIDKSHRVGFQSNHSMLRKALQHAN